MADLYIETEQLKKYGDRLLTSKANLEMYLTELNNAVTNITDGWNDDCGVNFKEKFAENQDGKIGGTWGGKIRNKKALGMQTPTESLLVKFVYLSCSSKS